MYSLGWHGGSVGTTVVLDLQDLGFEFCTYSVCIGFVGFLQVGSPCS